MANLEKWLFNEVIVAYFIAAFQNFPEGTGKKDDRPQ
jgi:hypothetical protein